MWMPWKRRGIVFDVVAFAMMSWCDECHGRGMSIVFGVAM
jgi:hypothetical protein